MDDLTTWTQQASPGSTRTHWWSAQDYEPIDQLPYVGSFLPGNDKVLVATGYAKWGMTNTVAAALALSGRLLGGEVEWAHVFQSWRWREALGAARAVKLDAAVGARMLRGWSAATLHGPGHEPPPRDRAGPSAAEHTRSPSARSVARPTSCPRSARI